VIKPNFSVRNDEFIKWEKRFLPGEKIGILILTTSKGVMGQKTAIKEGTGGRLLGYVY
jgi:small subunit ribosomal protein S8